MIKNYIRHIFQLTMQLQTIIQTEVIPFSVKSGLNDSYSTYSSHSSITLAG